VRYLITGGCGFLGSNLAAEALRRGDHVVVADNLSRTGATENLAWLRALGLEHHTHLDIRVANDVTRAVKDARPDRVFHLAGQVAMTTSLRNPRHDFEVNVVGGNNLLEAVREWAPEAVVLYSSTNKVYGDLDWLRYSETDTRYVAQDHPAGFDETLPLNFCSPYGCSKGATDQYMLDYARMFGLRTVVFRHSSIFGGRQFSSYDQGWIGWFVAQADARRRGRLVEPLTISGNGKQVRDVLFVADIVRCYFAAAERIDDIRGKAFNIGGGPDNSLSLRELFAILERELDVRLPFRELPWRESDQKVFIADVSRAGREFGWRPEVSKEEGLRQMIRWVVDHE
jgi:CDP-paratose 2-epimerase